jgi:hypothetical protein
MSASFPSAGMDHTHAGKAGDHDVGRDATPDQQQKRSRRQIGKIQ